MTSNDPVCASSVRILNAQKNVIGTGFVVSIFRDNTHALILTSTSVVERSFSLPINEIKQSVHITFYVDQEERHWKALILHWLGSERENACVLVVEGNDKLPALVRTLPLSLASDLYGRKVSIFGYPDTSLLFDGSWRYSEFCRPGPKHRITHDVFLQLEIQNWSDGYRGAPVWDDVHRYVLGMVTHTEYINETGHQGGGICALPVEILHKLCQNGLKQYGSNVAIRFEKKPIIHNDEPYTEGEAHHFFGYEMVTEKIMNALDKQRPKFLAILGPEKSGKTSVIQAGLFPRLRRGEIEQYRNYDFLTVHLSSKKPLQDLHQQGLYGTAEGLKEAIHRRYQTNAYRGMFLILDQFEDFLRNCPLDIQKLFIHQLLEAVNDTEITVIIALRDEFYSLFAKHEKLIEVVEQVLVNVFAPRAKDQLMSIMEQRSQQEDIAPDTDHLSSLIDQVLESIEQEKGKQNSPLARLNHYLTLEKRYETTNKTRKAETKIVPITLNNWAEDIFQKLDQEQQKFFKSLLLRLVLLGDEVLGIPDKKHYLPIEDICLNTDEYDLVDELIDQRFLLTNRDRHSNQEVVTILQDELIHGWPRLHEWLNEQRQFLSWQHQFQQQLNVWIGSSTDVASKGENELLQGYKLAEAENWLKNRPEAFDTHASQFIEMSKRKQGNTLDELKENYEKLQVQQIEVEQRHHKLLAHNLTKQGQELCEHPYSVQYGVQLLAVAHSLFPLQGSDKALRAALTRLPRKIEIGFKTQKHPIQLAVLSCKGRYAIAYGCEGQVRDIKNEGWRYNALLDSDIHAMAFSPDGAYLALAEKNGNVHLCFLDREEKPYRSNIVKEAPVADLLFSHNGRYLVITCWNNYQSSFKVFEIIEGEKTLSCIRIVNNSSRITAMSFNEGGNTLVVGYANGLVQIWEPGDKMGYPRFSKSYGNSVDAIALSRGVTYLALAFENGEVQITRIGMNRPVKYQHKDRIQFILFSPDDRYIISGSDDSTVKIYDVLQGGKEKTIKHTNPLHTAAFSSDGEYLVTASRDNMIQTWCVHQAFELSMQFVHDDFIQNLIFSVGKHYLIIAGNSSTISIWDVTKSAQCITLPRSVRVKAPVKFFVWDFNGSDYSILVLSEERSAEKWIFRDAYDLHSQPLPPNKPVRKIVASFDSKYLAIIGSDQIPYLWSSLADKKPGRIRHFKNINDLAFSHDGSFLAISCEKGGVSIWNIPDEKKQKIISHVISVAATAFGSDNRFLITGSNNGEVRILNWQEESEYLCLHRHSGKVCAVVVSPDGNHIATTGDDGSVCLWNLEGNLLFNFPIKGYIYAIQFDMSGKYLITGCKDHCAYIWRTTDGSLQHQLFHPDEVKCIAISLDGKYVATGSKDRTVGIWEITAGRQTALLDHSSEITTLAFSPDGKYLAVGCNDGTVKIWLWHSGHLICEAMSRITHILTEEEWKEYAGDEPYQIIYDLQQTRKSLTEPVKETTD